MGGSVAAGTRSAVRTDRAGRFETWFGGGVRIVMSTSEKEAGHPADDRLEQSVGGGPVGDPHPDGALQVGVDGRFAGRRARVVRAFGRRGRPVAWFDELVASD